MDTSLAAREDAATILKLYELRQEPTLRKARAWMAGEFWPVTIEDLRAVLGDTGSERNAFYRQVTTYWEMAAALVNHGILATELFVDTNTEPFYLGAKLWPFLEEMRPAAPGYLVQFEKLVERSLPARQKLEHYQQVVARRMASRSSHS